MCTHAHNMLFFFLSFVLRLFYSHLLPLALISGRPGPCDGVCVCVWSSVILIFLLSRSVLPRFHIIVGSCFVVRSTAALQLQFFTSPFLSNRRLLTGRRRTFCVLCAFFCEAHAALSFFPCLLVLASGGPIRAL